jgi:Kef-type K+ transport system membrane component KefB
VSLLVFSIITVFFNVDGNSNSFIAAAIPILYNILALVIGFLCGILLSKLLTEKRSYENRLILTITILLGISGLCSIFNISPLLACMLFGSTYISITDDKELYTQMNNFTPPILALFFILSGAKLDINSLSTLGLIGVVYFIIRIVGKYIGAFLGCEFVKSEKNIRNYLGIALIPQAGVSIGLAFLAQRILPVEIGNMLLSIILSSSVLYELIGPISAKYALIKSGAIKQ